MRSTFSAAMLFTLLLGCSVTGLAARGVREEFRVTEVFLKADDGRPIGPCPLRVVFRGYITANGPGTIKYTFTRSDGATGPVYIMEFKRAGTQPLMTDWTLGDSRVLPRYAGWQAVKVLSPVEIESNHETGSFEINCGGTTSAQTNPNQQRESARPSEMQYWRSTPPIKLEPNGFIERARLELTNTGNEPISVRVQFVDKDGKVFIQSEASIPHPLYGVVVEFNAATSDRSSPSGPLVGRLKKTTLRATEQGFPTGFRVQIGTTEAHALLLLQPTLRIFEKGSKGSSGATIKVGPDGFTKTALGPPVSEP